MRRENPPIGMLFEYPPLFIFTYRKGGAYDDDIIEVTCFVLGWGVGHEINIQSEASESGPK